MAKSETLEALLSPSLKVSRPVAACSRCRGAKIKCDGKLPACTACERAAKAESCSGANDEFARGKERSYVAALEAASEKLQKRITEAGSPQSPSTAQVLGNFAGSPFLGSTLGQLRSHLKTGSGSWARRKEASDVDDLVGDMGFLSINATSRDFHGFNSTISFAKLLLSISQISTFPVTEPTTLPPRYSITPLIQHYLDNIFALMPFFSETDLMASVSAVYQDSGRYARASDHWFVHMVLAISAGAISQSRGDENNQTALRHTATALRYAEVVLHPGSIPGLQAILLLVQYSLVDPEHFRTWHLTGMASRVMVDLGLHVEPPPEAKITREALDMRRRVFYCVYTLDRSTSMACGLAFSFTDDSAAVSLPSTPHSAIRSDQARNMAPQLFLRSLAPSLYLSDIRRVQSAAYQVTQHSSRDVWSSSIASAYVDSILADVRAWFSTIPDSLSQRHILFFRLESLYSQIFSLAPSCRIPPVNVSDLSKTLTFEYSIQYADQMQPVVEDSKWYAFLTYTDIQRVAFIGRQFLDTMWSNFDMLLLGGVPPKASRGPASAIDFPRTTSPLENCARAIRCINKIIEILEYSRQRWGLGSHRDGFEQASAVLMGKLRNRQQELGSMHHLSLGPTRQPQPQPPPPTPPPRQSHTQSTVDDGSHLGAAAAARPDRPRTTQSAQGSSSIPNQMQNPSMNPPMLQADQASAPLPGLYRATSHSAAAPERRHAYALPQGSLPRRSYERLGGGGGEQASRRQ